MLWIDPEVTNGLNATVEAERGLRAVLDVVQEYCDLQPYISGDRAGSLTATWNPDGKLLRIAVNENGIAEYLMSAGEGETFVSSNGTEFEDTLADYSKSTSEDAARILAQKVIFE